MWIGPLILAAILIAEFVYLLIADHGGTTGGNDRATASGKSLFGPYLIGVELASMLLLAGLVGAYHLGCRRLPKGGQVMELIPIRDGFMLAAVLFALGLVGVLVRRNVIFMLMSIEVMLNAAGLAFVVAGARWGQPDGQVMFLFILAMAAAEVSVGLALVLQFYHQYQSLDADAMSRMKG